MIEQMLDRIWVNFSFAEVAHQYWGAARECLCQILGLTEKGHCRVATEAKAMAPAFPEVGQKLSVFLKPLFHGRLAVYQPVASLLHGEEHHTE